MKFENKLVIKQFEDLFKSEMQRELTDSSLIVTDVKCNPDEVITTIVAPCNLDFISIDVSCDGTDQ